MVGIDERIEMLAARVEKLVRLRKAPVAERKVGIVLFNFPPNGGATGTAAYLGVFESLFATLTRMKTEGYTVDVPANVEALRERLIGGNSAR
jgi:magnesium chelatase subunit H